jgi:hypothetical protein
MSRWQSSMAADEDMRENRPNGTSGQTLRLRDIENMPSDWDNADSELDFLMEDSPEYSTSAEPSTTTATTARSPGPLGTPAPTSISSSVPPLTTPGPLGTPAPHSSSVPRSTTPPGVPSEGTGMQRDTQQETYPEMHPETQQETNPGMPPETNGMCSAPSRSTG